MAEDVVGLQELLRTMDGLPYILQKNLIVRALRKAGKPIAERAAMLAPDDPATPGSRIAKAMGVMVTDQTATGAIAKIGPSKHGFMGIFAEEGTATQKASPFLNPAFDQTQDEAYEILGDELGSSIEAEWAKRA